MGDEGYSIGGSETAGQSYAEFQLEEVDCIEKTYPPFPAAPEEDWPVLLYEVTFARASEPYVRGFVLLQLLLNICAFGCFWIPPQVGERMGLAITALLAAVASELTVASKLPAASELNWFVIFSMCSMVFSVSVVIQSAAVIYFYYYTGDDLVPTYVKQLRRLLAKSKSKKTWDNDVTQRIDNLSKTEAIPDNTSGNEIEDKSPELEIKFFSADGSVDSSLDNGTPVAENGSMPNHLALSSDTVVSSGNIRNRKHVSIADNPEIEEFECRLPAGGCRPQRPTLADKALMDMLVSSRTVIQHDASDFKDEDAKLNNARWQKVSVAIDEYSRLLFPLSFAIFVAVIFPSAKS